MKNRQIHRKSNFLLSIKTVRIVKKTLISNYLTSDKLIYNKLYNRILCNIHFASIKN